MRTIARVVLLLILVAPRICSQQSITFCELLRHPDEYNDREVTVRATLRYGFETQDLYCLSCRDVGRIRLELVDDPEAKISDSDRIGKATGGMGLVNLTVRGRFSTGKGSMFKIVAYEIRDIVTIAKHGKNYEKAEKEFACGGTRPK